MRWKPVIAALVGLFVSLAVITVIGAQRPTAAPAVVHLIGFTNSSDGAQVAQFQIRNQSKQRIARNGYCRIDGRVVDIAPTKTLAAGDSEIVEVPLNRNSDGPDAAVRFNGVRDLGSFEAALSDVASLLGKLGINGDWLDATERRRWEVGVDFRTEAPPIAPRPPATSPEQSGPNLRK